MLHEAVVGVDHHEVLLALIHQLRNEATERRAASCLRPHLPEPQVVDCTERVRRPRCARPLALPERLRDARRVLHPDLIYNAAEYAFRVPGLGVHALHCRAALHITERSNGHKDRIVLRFSVDNQPRISLGPRKTVD